MSYEEEEVTCEEEDTHTRAVTFENVWGAPSHNNAQKSWPDYYRDPCICNRWPFSSARGSGARVPPTHRRTAPLTAALAARCLAHLSLADHICCAALLVAGRPLLRLEIFRKCSL